MSAVMMVLSHLCSRFIFSVFFFLCLSESESQLLPEGILRWSQASREICLSGVYSGWSCPKNHTIKLHSQIPKLSHLAPGCGKAGALLLVPPEYLIPNPHPVSKVQARHPSEKTNFCSLYPQSYSFSVRSLRPQVKVGT